VTSVNTYASMMGISTEGANSGVPGYLIKSLREHKKIWSKAIA